MNLLEPTQELIQEMMSWINDERELSVWAGPNFRYPFTLKSFTEDLQLGELSSYCLSSSDVKAANDADALLAFGQFYQRLDKCHLARLLVAPQQRGNGLVKVLIKSLSACGRQKFGLDGDSLFVLPENTAAIRAYTSIGFEVLEYPEQSPLKDCLYMIRS